MVSHRFGKNCSYRSIKPNKHTTYICGALKSENPHFRLGNPGKTLTLTVGASISYGAYNVQSYILGTVIPYGFVEFEIFDNMMGGNRYVDVL